MSVRSKHSKTSHVLFQKHQTQYLSLKITILICISVNSDVEVDQFQDDAAKLLEIAKLHSIFN